MKRENKIESTINDLDNNDGGDGIGRNYVYKGSREEVVLVLLSDSYLELETISVSASGPSSYLTLHCLLTI